MAAVICTLTDDLDLTINDTGEYILCYRYDKDHLGYLIRDPILLANSIKYAYSQLKIHEKAEKPPAREPHRRVKWT